MLLNVLRGHWVDVELALHSSVQDLLNGRNRPREQSHLILLDQVVLRGKLNFCFIFRLGSILYLFRQSQMHHLRLYLLEGVELEREEHGLWQLLNVLRERRG